MDSAGQDGGRAQKVRRPRLSIAERYASREEYMGKFEQAATKLIEQRFLLQEDLPAIMERGKLEWKVIAEQ